MACVSPTPSVVSTAVTRTTIAIVNLHPDSLSRISIAVAIPNLHPIMPTSAKYERGREFRVRIGLQTSRPDLIRISTHPDRFQCIYHIPKYMGANHAVSRLTSELLTSKQASLRPQACLLDYIGARGLLACLRGQNRLACLIACLLACITYLSRGERGFSRDTLCAPGPDRNF